MQTARSKAVLPILEAATRVVLLSGTPALSRPAELFTQLKGLLPSARLSYSLLADRFCVGDKWDSMKGSKNMDELYTLLVCTSCFAVYQRRLAKQAALL
jgi:SWI/SNF-related matrix-associated actin-dependent regulator of chromatin subfamily A-like protein 1